MKMWCDKTNRTLDEITAEVSDTSVLLEFSIPAAFLSFHRTTFDALGNSLEHVLIVRHKLKKKAVGTELIFNDSNSNDSW
jgi:hypothetical protein